MQKLWPILIIALTIGSRANAQPQLRSIEEATPFQGDWLIETPERRAEAFRGANRDEIALDNGLVRRTFRLAPNAATVGYDNLMTGASIIRGVKPEAIVEIGGTRYNVGGLVGQPNYAYLLEEWVDDLKADPNAFRFTTYEVGETKPRFDWNRKRYSAELPWPPQGVSLTLNFEASPDLARRIVARQAQSSGWGRPTLLSDDFKDLATDWALRRSPLEGASFENEGKTGVIKTGANTCVYVEKPLPSGVAVVECRIDPGTDASADWGPGIALAWPERTVKFSLMPARGCFGVGDWAPERRRDLQAVGAVEPNRPYTLRVRIEPTALFCEASLDGETWFAVHEIALDKPLGDPSTLRLGKTSRFGDAEEIQGSEGEVGWCQVGALRVYGPLDAQAKERQAQDLEALKGLAVAVRYEMYDGIPLLMKWVTVANGSTQPVRLTSIVSEVLAAVESHSDVELPGRWSYPNIHIESDYSMQGMSIGSANKTTHWLPDPDYLSQVNYLRQTPVLLESRPPIGPDVLLAPGDSYESIHTFELVHDSTERERQGLAVRRMYRTIAPWTTENPILMHVRSAEPEAVRLAVDQCAEVGFEMVIMTFGSGFNIEDEDPAYMAGVKELVDYAHSKGIELGGYSLLASRRVSDADDAINPKTGKPGGAIFGNSPCLGSEWGREYFRKVYKFIEQTGLDLLEHDGSYPGDVCASTLHAGHRGLADSQWTQWKTITDFYKWCRARGTYLNVPDWYFLTGSNKNGMGYREDNWSLPRARQIILGRQNIFDGTWEKTSSMGWMFVPLVQYHGGGAAATLEPLSEHLDAYEAHLAQNFGLGVQACYRGPRLYDTEATKAIVKKWADFYHKHRAILDSDLIHVRRADGRDIDCMLHVNPHLTDKGLAMVFNPLERKVKRTLELPLYYTGLSDTARIREREGDWRTYKLDRQYKVEVEIEMEPQSATWLLVQ